MTWRRMIPACCLLVALSACSTEKAAPPSPTKSGTNHDVEGIVTQPLADLNITTGDIPPVLAISATNPYAPPRPFNCVALQFDIDALNLVLGPDLAAPAPGTKEEDFFSGENAGNAVWSAANSAAMGFIPFRGVIRFVTGAERHDERLRDAVLAGFVRRAYLKGLRRGLGCLPLLPGAKPLTQTSAPGK